jgi:EmrB/QacA subfamily drug resistance transporter
MVMAVISLGTLMSTVDMGGIRVILPHLEQAYETSPDVVVWVSLIWVLVGSSLMLSMGRAADIFGGKSLYILGFAILTLGLVLCSVAGSILQLVVFRFIQSFGAAMTIAIEYAVVTAAFPSSERGKALGIMGGIAGLGLLGGPVLGGLCLDLLGWRSFFYLRIPFGIATIILSQIILKAESSRERRSKFDVPGAVTFFLALVSLFFALTQGQRLGWSSPWILTSGLVGISFLISFIVMEKKVSQPVLDLTIFRNRLFSIAVVSHILFYVATVTVNFAMPFYLIDGLGFSASISGVLLVTTPALALLLSPSSGRLSDKFGTFVLCASGLVLNALGLFLLSEAAIDSSIGSIVFYLVLIGVGTGLFVAPNTSAIIGAVRIENLGSASAMAGTLRHLGMSIGLAISGGVFATVRSSHASLLASEGGSRNWIESLSTVGAFQKTILVAFIIGILAIAASLFRGRVRRPAP